MNKHIEPKTTWEWLSQSEQEILNHFREDAEAIINTQPIDLITEERFYPFTPVGIHAENQGKGLPWLPEKRIVVNASTSHFTTIHHPNAPGFTKSECRRGMMVRTRDQHNLQFKKLVMAVMRRQLHRLRWNIYSPSHSAAKEYHIYLLCSIPGPHESKTVSLYVPSSYFKTRDYSEVEQLHTRVAVGYYKGTGFNVEPEKLKLWQEQTAAALDCQEARKMREIVERIRFEK